METTEFFTQLVNFLLAQDPKELKNRIFWKEILVKSNLKEKMREIKKDSWDEISAFSDFNACIKKMVIKKEFCLIEFHCSEYHHGNFINIFSKTTGIKTFVLTGGCCQGDIDHILGGYNENEDLTPEEMKKKFHFVDLLSSEGDGSKFEKFKNLQTIKEVDKEIKLEKISLLETNIKRIEGEISQLKKEIED